MKEALLRKLANLLSNNGAKNLSDTQDVLDQVEQYLCKAVRKVINYIDVADEHSEKDAKVILEKLETCYKDCQAQLDQVKEFLFIMAEFLNKQGSDDTTPETLDVYKQCILKSIHEEIQEKEANCYETKKQTTKVCQSDFFCAGCGNTSDSSQRV